MALRPENTKPLTLIQYCNQKSVTCHISLLVNIWRKSFDLNHCTTTLLRNIEYSCLCSQRFSLYCTMLIGKITVEFIYIKSFFYSLNYAETCDEFADYVPVIAAWQLSSFSRSATAVVIRPLATLCPF